MGYLIIPALVLTLVGSTVFLYGALVDPDADEPDRRRHTADGGDS